jgi:hypothetical protein
VADASLEAEPHNPMLHEESVPPAPAPASLYPLAAGK